MCELRDRHPKVEIPAVYDKVFAMTEFDAYSSGKPLDAAQLLQRLKAAAARKESAAITEGQLELAIARMENASEQKQPGSAPSGNAAEPTT